MHLDSQICRSTSFGHGSLETYDNIFNQDFITNKLFRTYHAAIARIKLFIIKYPWIFHSFTTISSNFHFIWSFSLTDFIFRTALAYPLIARANTWFISVHFQNAVVFDLKRHSIKLSSLNFLFLLSFITVIARFKRYLTTGPPWSSNKSPIFNRGWNCGHGSLWQPSS